MSGNSSRSPLQPNHHNTQQCKLEYSLTGCSPKDNWMGFPFCTHLIISSIIPSVNVNPRTSGAAWPVLDELPREPSKVKPASGTTREGILKDRIGPGIEEFMVFVEDLGSSGSLPSHEAG